MRDFRGGLNLSADEAGLRMDETPDCMNVDIDPRGGWHLRRGSTVLNTASPLVNDAKSAYHYTPAGGSEQYIVNDGPLLRYGTGSTLTSMGYSNSFDGPARYAVANDTLYLQRYRERSPIKWDGTTATNPNNPATSSWQNDLAAGGGTHLPFAKCIEAHLGYLWVANTDENGTEHRSRLRWSHPGDPESWREDDYIDVAVGKDTDEITALASFQDHLLVFKRHSVHAVYGFDPFSFQVVQVAGRIGCVSQEALAVSATAVWFFDERDGLFEWDGKSMRWRFEKIAAEMEPSGSIATDYIDTTHVGWLNTRCYVSVPWASATTPNRTFVFDPTVSKDGAWSVQDVGWTCHTPFGDNYLAVCTESDGTIGTGISRLEQDGTWVDEYLDSGVQERHYDSWLRTAWVEASHYGQDKRWRRPDFVMKEAGDLELLVEVFEDFDPRAVRKSYRITVPSPSGSALYGTAVYGTDEWSAEGDGATIVRGSTLGLARAVSVRMNGPTSDDGSAYWGCDGMALKFKLKRMKG